MMIKTNPEQLEELRKMTNIGFIASIGFCFLGTLYIQYINPLGSVFYSIAVLMIMYPCVCLIRYVKNRQDAMIRIFCDNLKEFEDDLNNPCYWMEGEDADPDEYVPSGGHDPEDPSIK